MVVLQGPRQICNDFLQILILNKTMVYPLQCAITGANDWGMAPANGESSPPLSGDPFLLRDGLLRPGEIRTGRQPKLNASGDIAGPTLREIPHQWAVLPAAYFNFFAGALARESGRVAGGE
jgi:hypothetical protein